MLCYGCFVSSVIAELWICLVNTLLHFARRSQVTSIKQDYDQAEGELNIGRSKLKECDSQINRMAKEQQKLQQQLSDSNVERKKMENEVEISATLFAF